MVQRALHTGVSLFGEFESQMTVLGNKKRYHRTGRRVKAKDLKGTLPFGYAGRGKGRDPVATGSVAGASRRIRQ
jgi:hypothetical protein